MPENLLQEITSIPRLRYFDGFAGVGGFSKGILNVHPDAGSNDKRT